MIPRVWPLRGASTGQSTNTTKRLKTMTTIDNPNVQPLHPDVILSTGARVVHQYATNGSQNAIVDDREGGAMTEAEWDEYAGIVAHQNSQRMVTYPWDDVPHWSPVWDEIKGKAHLYKTSFRRSDGKCVGLAGVAKYVDGLELIQPCFKVRDEFGIVLMETRDLCGFCL